MIDKQQIASAAEAHLAGTDGFLVAVNVAPGNAIEVVIDSDSEVSIDDCALLSRAIEQTLDRDTEDFELTVASAGIGQPLTLPRQFHKLIGHPVEVVLKSGGKAVGELVGADGSGVTITREEKTAVEGSKRKKLVPVTKTFAVDEIKLTREYLDFK